ncbi:MAG TPA: prepilin-type N-terminal cleavage/methylation domain-containing protein [Solirubrobacteraceae bacterium]|nr:prepilin-type N-terminal cleavage/methylation domain-containing protein [Solirubrobacteraceae bacterium]
MTLRDERGFTLIELLLVMTLSLVILGATLTTFNNVYSSTHENNERNDTAEIARNGLDIQARQLRNLAKRVSSPVIDTVGAYDLIFQTSDPSRTWVRYCLDTSTAPASADRGRLWTAELAVPDAAVATPVSAGMRSGCPGTGWSTTRVVADHVTNRRAGLNRPLFEYSCGTGTTCTSNAATYDQVVGITARTIVDTTPGTQAPELRVVSAVYLRNQNQAPLASFVSSPSSTSRTIVLNASGSSDFEGRTLNYYWFKQTMPALASIDCARPTVTGADPTRTLWGAAGYLGEGITLTHTFPASDGAAGTSRNIGLVACDPGDRSGTAGTPPQAAIAVQIPS